MQFFDTLPDVLERKAGLTPEQVVKVQDECDRVRQSMRASPMTTYATARSVRQGVAEMIRPPRASG